VRELEVSFISAQEWKKMETRGILGSFEVALRILAKRPLHKSDKDYVVEIIKDLLSLITPI